MSEIQNTEKLPRYNHYVPRFILDSFAVKGQLCILDKHTLKQFKLPPYRAMGEKDFTNVRTADAIVSFENRFTHIEDLAAPIIAKILQQRSLEFLSPNDEATLHMFVVIQLLRSKRRRLDQVAMSAHIRDHWPEIELNPLKDVMTDEEFEKFSALNLTFSNLEELTAPLVTKHTYLILKHCAGELYISDNPMVMHNSKDFGPYGNIGLAVPYIEIYYPLSPEIVLAYMCPQGMNEIEKSHIASEKEVDVFFGQKFLSPTGLTTADKIKIEKARAEILRQKNHYALIKSKRVVPMTADNLLFLNSLQVLSSFRYIACRKSCFDFAVKALSEKPHWKEGVGLKIG